MCDMNDDNTILGGGDKSKASNNKQTKNEMKNMCSFMDQIDDFMESGFLWNS